MAPLYTLAPSVPLSPTYETVALRLVVLDQVFIERYLVSFLFERNLEGTSISCFIRFSIRAFGRRYLSMPS